MLSFCPAVDVNCWQDFVFILFLFVLSAYFYFGLYFIVFVYKSVLNGLKIALFLILWYYVRCNSITLAYKAYRFRCVLLFYARAQVYICAYSIYTIKKV